MASKEWAPMRWPAGWAGAGLLEVLKGTPINCLVAGQHAARLREPAARFGITVFEAPPAEVSVVDGVWPGMRMSQERRSRDEAEAGPTGAPWIDSNYWLLRLARARGPKPIWAAFDPAQDAGPATLARYQLAIADVAAAGGDWIISLAGEFSAALGRRESAALEDWRKIGQTVVFFQNTRIWRNWPSVGPLAVISDFAGDNEFLAGEVLNLAARRNLLYRVVDKRSLTAADLTGPRAALYTDGDAPPPELAARLTAFVKAGGLLIAPANVAAKFPGPAGASPIEGYDVRVLGKGRVAAPQKEWEDPFLLAADAHILMSRRYDPVRVFNASSLYVSCLGRGTDAVIQMVNFARRESGQPVSVALARAYSQARFHTWGAEPAPLKPVPAGRGVEFHLPPFALYAAIELGGAK